MPFTSPNYTQTPNDLFDLYLSRLSQAELKTLLALIRLTFGYQRERARISITKLCDMTGLTRSSVLKGIGKLEELTLITRLWDGGVAEYILYIDDGIVQKIDQSGLKNRPLGLKNGLRSIKENGLNKATNNIIADPDKQSQKDQDQDQQSPHPKLVPDTDGAYLLFNMLGDEYALIKRKPPERFPSKACKDKFIKAENDLGSVELENAITKALEKPILSISGITAFVAKWKSNPPRNGSKPPLIENPNIGDADQAKALIAKALSEKG